MSDVEKLSDVGFTLGSPHAEKEGVLPQVSIVIANWNKHDLLQGCLRSLEETSIRQIGEVIVVDNASTDGSCEMVERRFPWARLIRSDSNLGFAGGNNVGVREARGEIVFFLNNDTEVAPRSIERLWASFMVNPQFGIVGCLVRDLYDRHRVQEAGMSIDRFGFPIPTPLRDGNLPPFYVSGCALAVRRSLIDRLGLFDERYFLFAEDVDVCWRYRLAGWEVGVASDAEVFHLSGGSITGGAAPQSGQYHTSANRVYLRERNTLATLLKNYSTLSLVYVLPAYMLAISAEILAACLLFRFRLVSKYLQALAWNILNLKETVRLRRWVQGLRSIPDQRLPFDRRWGKLLSFRLVGMPKVV